MSLVRQCDRCGAVFAPYRKRVSDHEKKPTAFVGICIDVLSYETGALVDGASTAYDLCPKCSKQLSVFMENTNTTVEQYLNDKVKEYNETVKAGDEDNNLL